MVQKSAITYPRVEQSLCPFTYHAGVWLAQPQRPFRPRGLMIWDAPPKSSVQIMIGCDLQLVVDVGPLPTRWFSSFQSFEQIAKAIDEQKEPPAWGTWRAVEPGMRIMLRIEPASEDLQLVMWGDSVS